MPRRDAAVVFILYALVWSAVSVPVLVSPLGSYPVIDASWHFSWARAVADGDLFIYAPYFRAPLYPMTLALLFSITGSSMVAGALLSFVLSAASVHLVQRTVWSFAGRLPSLLAAAAVGLNGVFLFYGSTLLITPLYLFLLILAFHLFNREKPSSLAWLSLGLAAVARPSALLLFPLCLFLHSGRIRRSSWLFFLPLAAVWAVNWAHGDPGTVISSQGGVNLYIGSGPRADGYTAFAPEREGSASLPDSLPYVDNVWASSVSAAEPGASPSDVSALWTKRTVDHVIGSPVETLGLLGRKLLLMVSPVAIPSNYDVYHYGRYSPVLGLLTGSPSVPVAGLLIWMLLPGALFAGRLVSAERNALLWMLALAAGMLPFFITARFVLPMLPFIVILLAPRFLRAPGRSLLLAVPGLAAGLVLAGLTASTAGLGGVNMAFHDGVAHYRLGLSDKAELLLLEALDTAMDRNDGVDLNGTDALHNLGVIAADRGDYAAAESWWRQALRRNPEHAPSLRALQGLTGQLR